VLSAGTKQELETKLSSLDASTSAQISVVTIKTMGNDTIENFAEKLFKEWGIGQKGKDNGVLLLVAVDDRKVRIEVGYGLEGALTDAETSQIIRNVITPAFKSGDYNEGISSGVDAILVAASEDLISTNTAISNTTASETLEGLVGIIMFGVMCLLWFISILSRSKSWWLGGVVGGVAGGIFGGIWGIVGLGLLGLFIDFAVSKQFKMSQSSGNYPWWIGGKNGVSGWSSGGSGGGFGGFGGGRSGGGGSSGSW